MKDYDNRNSFVKIEFASLGERGHSSNGVLAVPKRNRDAFG
jgi:hypothetical protein